MSTTNESNDVKLLEIFVSYLAFMTELAVNKKLYKKFKNNPAHYLEQNVGLKFPSRNFYLEPDPVGHRWCKIWVFLKEPVETKDGLPVQTIVYNEAIRLASNKDAKVNWGKSTSDVSNDAQKPSRIEIDKHQFDLFRVSDLPEYKYGIKKDFSTIKGKNIVPSEFFPGSNKYIAEQIPVVHGGEYSKSEVEYHIPVDRIDDCFIYVIFPFLALEFDRLNSYQVSGNEEVLLSPCS